jgi:carbonic anhydrase/acetyltransferase-like protein (isoleucine patch superfamily)
MTVYRLGDRVPQIDAEAWIHPSAQIIGDVHIGPGASIWPGAVLRGDFGRIEIGARSTVQDNCVLHAGERHPTVIGATCVLGHLVHVEGARVGDGALLGVGSVVLPGAVVEPWAVVAANAVVLGGTRVPTGFRAQGVPAELVAIHRDPDASLAELAVYDRIVERYRSELVEVPR